MIDLTEQLLLQSKKPDYVTDGLVLWLDGIRNTRNGHNASAATWEDLSGNGNDFSSIGTPVFASDHCAFDKTFYFEIYHDLFYNGTQPSLNGDGSCEICFCEENPSAKSYFAFRRSNGAGSALTWGGQFQTAMKTVNSTKVYDYYPTGNVHLYFDKASCLANGVELQQTGVDYWTDYGGARIGALNQGTYLGFFKLYSLRIYNRVLTAQEQAQNYLADQKRFKL